MIYELELTMANRLRLAQAFHLHKRVGFEAQPNPYRTYGF